MTIEEMIADIRDKISDTDPNTPLLQDATIERQLKQAMFMHFRGEFTDLADIPEAEVPLVILFACSLLCNVVGTRQAFVNNATSNNTNTSHVAVNLGGALSVSETSAVASPEGTASLKDWQKLQKMYKDMYDSAVGEKTSMPTIEVGYLVRTDKLTGMSTRRQWQKAPPVANLSMVDSANGQVLLGWTYPARSLEQARSIQIWYDTKPGVRQNHYSKWNVVTPTSTRGFYTLNLESRNAKITNLTPGTTYYFKVFTFNLDPEVMPSESNELIVVCS